MDKRIKHYIYISDMKVDMLYSQIDEKLLKKIAVELSIDLKPLGAGVGATFKRTQPEETRYSKLRLILEYIEKHFDIGWVDAPGAYFKGSLPMRWGPLTSSRSMSNSPHAVYFVGSTNHTVPGMVGSAYHMIGSRGEESRNAILFYTPGEILKALADEIELPKQVILDMYKSLELPLQEKPLEIADSIIKEIDRASGYSREKRYNSQFISLEFLAKTYVYGDSVVQSGKKILLGSPLYVAFAT